MSAKPRLIDAHLPSSRVKPMKILCLGMPRTGTESLNAALEKLGYTTHKAGAIMKNYKVNIPLWHEALRAQYEGIGEHWGTAEFDVMLGNYDCVLDVPGLLLVEDLVAAYPDAKVILTNRDENSWLRSMQETAGKGLTWWTYPYIWIFHENSRLRVGFLWKCMEYMCDKDLSDGGPARLKFRDHNDLVRRIVPADQLLEFRAVQGWKPLCQFLDKKVPDETYPCVNDRKFLSRLQHLAYYYALLVAVLKIGFAVFIVMVIWQYLRQYGGLERGQFIHTASVHVGMEG